MRTTKPQTSHVPIRYRPVPLPFSPPTLHPEVVPQFTVDVEDRLDRFLTRLLPEHSRTRLARLADDGGVRVDGVPRPPGFRLRTGMIVDVDDLAPREAHDLTPVAVPLSILFEDEDMIVVDKPRGLASHPAIGQRAPTLVHALLARNTPLSSAAGGFRPGIVHRLDMETTGLLVVAKNDAAHRHLAAQIQAKSAERRYLALVMGRPDQARFRVEAPIGRDPTHRKRMAVISGGKNAATEFSVIRSVANGTLVGCRLETGRTHQIRVHALALGMPLVGDALYAPPRPVDPPLRLHAALLALTHPRTGVRLQFSTAPPDDFPEACEGDLTQLLAVWPDRFSPAASGESPPTLGDTAPESA